MQNNEFLCVNNIIYQIYNVKDFCQMRLSVLNLLNTLIPNSCASFLMADHSLGDNLLCDPICLPDTFVAMEQNYLSMEKDDFSRWIMLGKQPMTIRASDLLADEKRMQTTLYQKCFAPYGLHYSMDLSIIREEIFLGLISIYRKKEEGDFTNDEVFLLRSLSDHLNVRLYREYLEQHPLAATDAHASLLHIAHRYSLTERETQVLGMIFDEKNTEDIAAELCISTHTLKKHTQNLYRKLDVSSRWELLKYKE